MQHEIDHLDGILFLDRLTGDDKLFKVEPANEEASEETNDSLPADQNSQI
jgi:peptide deformylase